MVGTTSNVNKVAYKSPPMAVIASGCKSSDPSPKPSARIKSQITVVSAVINIGRNLV